MATNDKRARKKQFRDEAAAAREAKLQRRRLIRFGVLGLIIVALIGFALFSGKDDDDTAAINDDSTASAAATPAESERPAGVACDGDEPPPSDPKQYDAPKQVMKKGVDYAAVISTSCGDIEIDLLEEEAPKTVNSFIFLSQEGFYDGLTWHRIVSNFVIQGGDPEGNGQGGPGYVVSDEFPDKGEEYIFGTVAMANAGPGTTGSQFFIVVHEGAKGQTDEPVGLDPLYSLFGRATEESFEVIKEISKVEVGGQTGESPVVPVYINSIEIIER